MFQGVLPDIPNNNGARYAAVVVSNETQFQHDGTLFQVVDVTVDGEEGICEVEETSNPNYIV